MIIRGTISQIRFESQQSWRGRVSARKEAYQEEAYQKYRFSRGILCKSTGPRIPDFCSVSAIGREILLLIRSELQILEIDNALISGVEWGEAERRLKANLQIGVMAFGFIAKAPFGLQLRFLNDNCSSRHSPSTRNL
ncbi:hypothetical protein R1flu_000845 [Riccia fluitans]|uniref:Uncharacterized protein n=1 Tax=Riccia fluitans TaxID=41844 RepID=A0ABD1Y1K9_9MARC